MTTDDSNKNNMFGIIEQNFVDRLDETKIRLCKNLVTLHVDFRI